MKTAYHVEVWKNGDKSTAIFSTKQTMLDALYIMFAMMDEANKYTNCKYFENGFKDRNCVKLGIDSSCRTWAVIVEKEKHA